MDCENLEIKDQALPKKVSTACSTCSIDGLKLRPKSNFEGIATPSYKSNRETAEWYP